jgi:hypothetical protein
MVVASERTVLPSFPPQREKGRAGTMAQSHPNSASSYASRGSQAWSSPIGPEHGHTFSMESFASDIGSLAKDESVISKIKKMDYLAGAKAEFRHGTF